MPLRLFTILLQSAREGIKSIIRETNKSMKYSVRELSVCGMMAALICVLAPVSLPLVSEVPISLATLAVMLCGVLLGRNLGSLAVLIYIILGAIGLPVFAGWSSGLGIILGVTGGYIIGYLPLAWISGYFSEKFGKNCRGFAKYAVLTGGMILGNAVLYLIGTIWFIKATGMGLAAAMSVCVIPFIPGDLIKTAVVAVLAERLESVSDAVLRRSAAR